MKCPNCGEEPITLGAYLTKLNTFTIHCRNCGVKLAASKRTRRSTILSIVIAFLIGFSIFALGDFYDLGSTTKIQIAVIAGLITAIVSVAATWKIGKYEIY